MRTKPSFQRAVAKVFRLWRDNDHDTALERVEALQRTWPGNAQLSLLWASLAQLQEDPKHSLDEVRQALETARDLDRPSPCGAIELGHFLDGVDDNPLAASKAYTEAVSSARKLLMEGLIGQARTYRQLAQGEKASKALRELLYLLGADSPINGTRSGHSDPDALFRSAVEELLNDMLVDRSA